MNLQANAGDTYHNRFSKDSPYKGNKSYKKLPKKCAKCGTTSGQLDIDHKDGNRSNNNRSNLRVLCRSCHRKMHAKRNGGKGSIDTNRVISTAARVIADPKTEASQAIASANQNSDLMHVEFILCHADKNDNYDEFTPEDLAEAAHTAVNKPINWEHSTRNIGVIYESKYCSVDDLSEADNKYYGEIDPLEKDFVVCRAAIWEYKHPFEARVMRQRAEDGNLSFSMENKFGYAKCSECNESFETVRDYCDHLLTRYKTGKANRIFADSNFVGAAVTKTPADKFAGMLALASVFSNDHSFASFLNSKAMSDMDIERDLIPYIVTAGDKNMKIRELEIPEEFLTKDVEGLDLLPENAFADVTNRVFPLDCPENIEASAERILDNKLEFYSKAERLYIIQRLAEAAQSFDIELEYQIPDKDTDLGGIEEMGEVKAIDRDSKEFKQAVDEAVASRLKEIESGAELESMKEELAEANSKIDGLQKKIEEADSAKAEIEKQFNEYKDTITKEKAVAARLDELAEAGIELGDKLDSVKSQIEKMDDEAFASFKDVLVSLAAKKEIPDKELTPEEKKKMEEEKKKKKDKEAKASGEKDPVDESQETAVASKTDDPSGGERFSEIDKALSSMV